MQGSLPFVALLTGTTIVQWLFPLPRRQLFFLITTLYGKRYKKNHILVWGMLFIAIFIVLCALVIIGTSALFQTATLATTILTITLSLLAVGLGIYELSAIWWPRLQGIRIPASLRRSVYKKLQSPPASVHMPKTIVVHGSFTVLFGIMPTICVFRLLNLPLSVLSAGFMAACAILFAVPLIYVLLDTRSRNNLASLSRNLHRFANTIHLLYGCYLIILGWLLLLSVNNALSFR
jgi:hypothetical protein